jgi:hypothetical protein
MALGSIALVGSVCAVRYLPTNDGPQAIFSAHVDNHYGDPGSIFQRQLLPASQFAHRGFSLLFAPLETVMPWDAALRITLCVIALTTAWGFAALVTALEPERRALAPLGFAVACSWQLYMGFFAYEWALGIGLLVVAYVLRRQEMRPRDRVLVAVLLLLQASCHLFAAMLTGPVIAALLLARAPAQGRGKEAVRVLLVAAPALAVFAATLVQRSGLERIPLASQTVWVPFGTWVRELPHLVAPGPAWRGWLVLVAVIASLAHALARRAQLSPGEKVLAGASAVLLGAALAGPMHISGWQFFAPRFLPLAVLFALALLPVERLATDPARHAAAACVFAIALGLLAVSTAMHRRMASACGDVLSGLWVPLHRTGMQLPMVLDAACGASLDPAESEAPYVSPALHLGALYAVAHGGSMPYLFSGSSSVHSFTTRADSDLRVPIPPVERFWTVIGDPAFRADAALRARVVTELAAYGTHYESIAVFGARPDDARLLESIGYVADWQQGSLFLGKHVPCAATLALSGPAGTQPRLSWGLAPLEQAMVDTGLPPLPPLSERVPTVSLKLDDLACGAVWLRVSTPAGACAGADPSGRLQLQLSRGQAPVVACALP